jgi:hypothetical protein
MFEKRVLKRITMRWVGHTTRMAERRGAYRVLVGKSEGMRPLRRLRRRWNDDDDDDDDNNDNNNNNNNND